MSRNEFIPRLRFKKFYNNWQPGHLSDIGVVKSCKRIFNKETNTKKGIPFYKIGTFGGKATSFISKKEYLKYKSKYPYPRIGDILLSASGTLGRTVVYKGQKAYYQDSNIVWLDTDKNKIYSPFLLQFYNVVHWGGVEGSTIKRLYNKTILNTKINLPSLSEQRLIGRFFAKLDKLISLQQAKCSLLKRQKRGYLQKLFPRKNESVPRVRFHGFGNKWNKVTVKELISKGKSGGTPSTSNEAYYNGNIPFLSITDVTSSNGNINDTAKKITKDGLNNSNAWLVPKGSLTLSMYASVGEVAKLNIDVATSQAFFNMIYKSPITANMMYYVFQWMQHNHGWAPLIATGTQGNLNASKIKSLKVLLPSLSEQRLIGSFFKRLDNNINLQKNKLNYLRKLKKAYLQKMFC